MIDEVSDVFDTAGAYALAQDELGRDGGSRAERADASFDVRHRFTADAIYELPFASGSALLGGWQLAGVVTLQSGQPYTVNTSLDVNLDGNVTDRLDTLSGLLLSDGGRTRISLAGGTTLSSLVAPLDPFHPRSGAVGRNTFRAAGVASVDLALSKRVGLPREQSLTLRVEAFNAFNRTHFGTPVRVLEAPGFGSSATTTVPARTVQFVVRYRF